MKINRQTRIITGLFIVLFAGVITTTPSCKWMAKTAAKHWTRKQKKKFVAKCTAGAIDKFSDRANDICKCLATAAEEIYPDAEEALALHWMKMIQISTDCIRNNP